MTRIDHAKREIHARVLYLGAEQVGKATNLDHIYTGTGEGPSPGRAYWELNGLEITLGEIRGFRPRFELWPVVGAPFYGASRKLVMSAGDGVAGIVWIIDSTPERQEANEVMADMFREELVGCGLDPATLPTVIQYNKRDLPNAVPLDTLRARFNPTNAPEHEAIATHGVGVFDTLKSVAKLVLSGLRKT